MTIVVKMSNNSTKKLLIRDNYARAYEVTSREPVDEMLINSIFWSWDGVNGKSINELSAEQLSHMVEEYIHDLISKLMGEKAWGVLSSENPSVNEMISVMGESGRKIWELYQKSYEVGMYS